MKADRHFTATGAVFNDRGEVLMIRHKKLKKWLMPGGHVEKNETPDDAARREVLEETGVHARIITDQSLNLTDEHCTQLATPLTVLLEDIEGNGLHLHIDFIYLMRAESADLHSDPGEITGIGWFSVEDALELDTYDNIRKTLILARNKRKAQGQT